MTQISNVIPAEGLHQFNLITNKPLIEATLTRKKDILVASSPLLEEEVVSEGNLKVANAAANYWLRCGALLVQEPNELKFSDGGFTYILNVLKERGVEPLACRYFLTNAHYRNKLNFSFESLKSAQLALNRLRVRVLSLFQLSKRSEIELGRVFRGEEGVYKEYKTQFWQAINDDLALPLAMSILWRMLKLPYAKLHPVSRLNLLLDWDCVLGFDLKMFLEKGTWLSLRDGLHGDITRIDPAVIKLAQNYVESTSDHHEADRLIERLKEHGFEVHGGWLLLPIEINVESGA